jgi:DNA-binding PadR family transcriptional regulator
MGNPFAGSTELLILQLLRDEPEGMYGLEIVRSSGEKLKRGTVYVTLGRMEEKGFIRSRVDKTTAHAGLPRPKYTLTATGQRVLEAARVMGMAEASA